MESQWEQNVTECDTSDEVDRKIAIMLIERPAISDQAIANTLAMSRAAINRRRNNQSVKRLVREALTIPREEIRRLLVKSIGRLENMLDDDDPKVRFLAAVQLTKMASDALDKKISWEPIDWHLS